MSEERGLFSRILVATDGSERAEEGVRQGSRLASALGASVTAVSVIDTRRPHDGDVEAETDRTLERALAVARSVGVDAEARVLSGDPAEAIVHEASEEGFDLVCVGPDAGVLGGALRVGQVAAHVLREAVVSTLVARHADDAFPSRIACGVDGSDASADTAFVAASVASATQAELRLIHVVPVFRGDNSEWTLDPEDESPPELEGSVLAAASRGVIPIREMAMGRPEHALLAVAERDGTDLFVVGHRGVSGLRRVFLGSVSEHVAHHARCSVLVTRDARSA